MKFGLWYDFRNPARWHRPYDQLYRENLDQAAWAETLGFHSIWLSEHHVTDDGYLPSMFPMLAALGMRTRAARLGTAVLLAPFQHPVRFAAQAGAQMRPYASGRRSRNIGHMRLASESCRSRDRRTSASSRLPMRRMPAVVSGS